MMHSGLGETLNLVDCAQIASADSQFYTRTKKEHCLALFREMYYFEFGLKLWEQEMTDTSRDQISQKIDAEIMKLLAETRQIGVNMFLAPVLAAAGLMGATAAIIKLFF